MSKELKLDCEIDFECDRPGHSIETNSDKERMPRTENDRKFNLEQSDRSKRRKTEEIRKAHTAEQLAYATQMKLVR